MSKNSDSKSRENAQQSAKNKTTPKIVNKTRLAKGRPVLLYTSAFVMLLSVISVGYYQPAENSLASTSTSDAADVSAAPAKISEVSIDDKLATDIAASFAVQTKMPIASNVANLSVSLAAKEEMSQTEGNKIAKPQIIEATSGRRTVVTHKVKENETVQSIAKDYMLSANTVRWANDISEDNLELGSELRILPIDGVLYTVKDDDTLKSIADKYKSSEERIIAFNDLEVKGLSKDLEIILPGGSLPENERPGYEAPTSSYSNSYSGTASYGTFKASYAISYPWGWCTYYAAAKGGAPGNWGNANTWAFYARQTPGWTVSSVPVPGAIAQHSGGWAGHVGIVDAVSADGTMIKYSDMNGLAGFGGVGHSGWVSASKFPNYIYR